MFGVLGYGTAELEQCNYRMLITRYHAHLINSWNHTAKLSQLIYNLNATVANVLGAKPKVKPRDVFDFHPFLKSKTNKGISVKAENITDLKSVAIAFRGQGRPM